jgi:hypothetical protein
VGLSQAAKEAKRAYYKKWRETNKEKQAAYYREWAKNNQDKVKAKQAKFWERKGQELTTN